MATGLVSIRLTLHQFILSSRKLPVNSVASRHKKHCEKVRTSKGFAVSYATTETLSLERQSAIRQALESLTNGRTWLSCEPPILTSIEGRKQTKHLATP